MSRKNSDHKDPVIALVVPSTSVSDIQPVIENLIKNTRTLLDRLIEAKTSSESPSMRLLLLQHLSMLLTALEKADIPTSCIPDLLSLVMPITEYLAAHGYGNTARRYHDWVIRLIKLRPGEFTTLLSDHLAAKGHLGKQTFDDKLDESTRSHPQLLGSPSNMISSLRDFLESWQIVQEDKILDADKVRIRAGDINQLEMEFLYQICLNLLASHQCRYASSSTIEPSSFKWASLQTAIINVAQRLKHTKDTSLAWHFLYTLQQCAPRETDWQQQLLHLLLSASQQILGHTQPDTEQMGDWQRYRASLFQLRQDLAVVLADKKKLGSDPQLRLAAAESYSRQVQALIQNMMVECTQLLGPAPGHLSLCFLVLGSLSREEVLPCSDFEAVCLVGDDKHTAWNSDDSRMENRYLASWYDYFQFKMISTGLRMDEDGINKGHPGEPELRKTPNQLIAMLRSGSDTPDKLYYSLLNAKYLYNVNGQGLFDAYQQELKKLFTTPLIAVAEKKIETTSTTTIMQQIAHQHLQSCIEYFQQGPLIKESSKTKVIQLKKDYWEPLIYLLHHLALYYGKIPSSTNAVINFLAENKLITPNVAEDLQTAVTDLYQLRWQQHHQPLTDSSTIELQRLQIIKNRLLIPCYHALSNWLSHHQWSNDPFAAYWHEQLPIWLEAKSLDEVRIDHVTDFLSSAQITSPVIYQQAYQQIINNWPIHSSKTRELTKYYYERLCIQLKTVGFTPAQYYAIIQAIGDTPLPDGTRWWRIDEELRWQKALAAHWLIADTPESLDAEIDHYRKKKLPLVWADGLPLLVVDEKKSFIPTTRCLLKASVAEKLINSNGKWCATPGLPGRRPVISYPNKYSPDYYIKPLPELPGIEYAIHALSQRWMGKATPISQFMTLTLTDDNKAPLPQHPRAYPILVSEAITQADNLAGHHFETALLAETKLTPTGSLSVQARLDPFHFTQWFFLSLLIHPEDGTPHNFVVIKTSNEKYRLISIDNDHHFVRPFLSGWRSSDRAFKDICTESKTPIPADPNAQQLLQVKTILYCLDQMQAPLNRQAVEAYLSLDLPALLQAWLEDLVQWDQHHQLLLLEKDQHHYLQGNCEHFSYIRPVFGSQTITRLYQTSERLRRFLLDQGQSSITHLECLRQVHPLIGRRYLPLHQYGFKKRSPIGRFKYLTDELKKIRSYRLPSSLSGRDILERMEGISGEEKLIEQIKHQTAHHPQETLTYLRQYLQEQKPLEQKKRLIQTRKFSTNELITLLSKEVLSPIHRAEILKIIPFSWIPKQDHPAIFQSLAREDYEALDISKVRGLVPRDWKQMLLKNINLQRLSLKSCDGIMDSLLVNLAEQCLALTDVTLNDITIIRMGQNASTPQYWPLLRRLDLKNCPRLESISLKAPKLESLYAADCPLLRTVSINSEVLRRLDLTRVRALTQLQLTGRASSWQSDWGIPTFTDKQSLPDMQRAWFLLGLSILFSSSIYGLVDEPQAHNWFEEYLKLQTDKSILLKLSEDKDKIKVLIAYLCAAPGEIVATKLQAVFDEVKLPLPTLKVNKEEKYTPYDQREMLARQLFLYLAQEGHLKELKLLSANLFPDKEIWLQKNASGKTAIHLALLNNQHLVSDFAFHQFDMPISLVKSPSLRTAGALFLEAAAYIGEMQWMQNLLEFFPEEKLWEQQGKDGYTAFHLALQSGFNSVLELACQQHAMSIRLTAGAWGDTPFIQAARSGQVKWMQRMIDAFPEEKLWEQQNRYGDNAFHLAVEEGLDSVLEFACKQEAMSIQTAGRSFLKAASSGQVKAMQRMIDAFPEKKLWEHRDLHGNTAFHLAVEKGHDSVLELACQQSAMSIRLSTGGYWGYTPFLLAACSGQVKAMQRMIDAFPEEKLWEQRDESGNTAFHLAVEKRLDSVLELACQQHAMSLRLTAGHLSYTPFLTAASSGQVKWMQRMIDAFPEEKLWEQKDKQGNTAFHLAVEKGLDAVLELACQQQAMSIRLTAGGWGFTPFLAAASSGQVKWMQRMIDAFPEEKLWEQKDKQGNTAFHLAVEKRLDSVLELACQQHAISIQMTANYGGYTPFLKAVSSGQVKAIQRMIDAFPEEKLWEQRDVYGNTAFHLALKKGLDSVLELACQQHAMSIRLTAGYWDYTPFLKAASSGKVKAMQRMIDAFPEEKLWEQQDKNGNTAFHLALEKGLDSVLELACQQHAPSIHVRDKDYAYYKLRHVKKDYNDGYTPFLKAAHSGQAKWVQRMIETYPEEKLWEQQDRDGNTAFHLALEKGLDSVLELACQQHAMSIRLTGGYEGYTPFLKAASSGQVKWIQRMIDAFPEEKLWEQQDEYGNTAFHLALEKKHDSVLEFACQQRATSIHVKDYAYGSGKDHNGYTPFLKAAYSGQVKWMQRMIDAFPEEKLWEQQDVYGNNAFHLALKNNHDHILEFACQKRVTSINVSNRSGFTPFLQAAYSGQVKWMQLMIDAFPEEKLWEQQDKDGNTIFHLALKKNHDPVLEFAFQQRSVLIHAKDLYDHTPFLAATYYGRVNWMKRLIEAFPEEKFWDQRDEYGNTAFRLALQKNCDSVLEFIFEQFGGISIRAKKPIGKYDFSPFTEAAYYGRLKWMQRFLETFPGENFWEHEGRLGSTACHLALEKNHDSILEFAFEQHSVPIHAKDLSGYTLFLTAAVYGRVKWIQRLIDTFPDEKFWQQQDPCGNTTIHLALEKNQDSVLEFAFQQRAVSIYAENSAGRNPFLEAAYYGRVNWMQRLLDAFPEEKLWGLHNKDGNTIFHLAFYYHDVKAWQRFTSKLCDDLEILKTQQNRYANAVKNHDSVLEFAFQQSTVPIHIKNFDGRTPFLEAACYGHVNWMQRMFDAFPEEKLWEQRDEYGNTAFHLALQENHDSVLELVCQLQAVQIHINNSNDRSVFLEAAYYGRVKWMQRLLEIFPDQILWDHRDKYGNTALHLAFLQKNDVMIDFCLARADLHCIHRTNHQGYSLLHIAAQENFIKWISLLISTYNLAIDQPDNIDTTPSMIAACQGHLAALKLLAEFKADLSLRDIYGDTAFTIAKYNSREEIAEWLIIQNCGTSPEDWILSSTKKTHPKLDEWLTLYGNQPHGSHGDRVQIPAWYSDLPTLAALLRQESLIEKSSNFRKNLFLIAISYGLEQVLDWLGRRGIHIEAKEDCERILKLAVKANQSRSLWYLIDRNKWDTHVQRSMILMQAAHLNYDSIVRGLLRRYPIGFFEKYRQSGSEALYATIVAGHPKIANRLLKAGARFKAIHLTQKYPGTLQLSHTLVPDADIAAVIANQSIAPTLEYLYLDHSQAAAATLSALEILLKTNTGLWQCAYPAIWQEPQYAIQFANIQKSIHRNRYKLWLAQWQLLLGITACIKGQLSIIAVPRMSAYLLEQIGSWLGWPFINWRISQAITIQQTFSRVNPEPIEIDLSAPEFLVEERQSQQYGWNCFDVAIDLPRNELVKFALAPEQEIICRPLLAPEIRTAAAITAILMNTQQDKDKSVENRRQIIMDLFYLLDIARQFGESCHQQQVVVSIHQELELIESKQENATINSLKPLALPEIMHKAGVQSIVNLYIDAHEQIKEKVALCNNLLGYVEGQRLSLTELRQFFTIAKNRETYDEAYQLFSEFNQTLLEKELQLDEYCNRPTTYQQYVREYYGKNRWFAFQPNERQPSANTSMVDIAARCKNQPIVIYQQQNNQWNPIYHTEDQKGESLPIEYRPIGRHFVALKPNPKYFTAIESMLLAQFGLFQNSTPKKSRDDLLHPVPKIICSYL